jgi:hypothetical protein
MDRINFESLRASSGTAPATQGPVSVPRHGPGQKFLMGPIPWNWLERAMRCPGKALHVGIHLWHRAFLTRSARVTLDTALLRSSRLTKDSASRGVQNLERAGLVTVERGAGRKLRITLRDAPL